MVDARASRTASGGMRHASHVAGLSTGVDSPALQCASPSLSTAVDMQYLCYKAVRLCGLDQVQNPARNEREKCRKAELQTPDSDSGLERP
jgi:hypothetical protein